MAMIHFYFDYIDPASRVMEHRVRGVAGELGLRVEFIPFEVRTPSDPPLLVNDPGWLKWWDRMVSELEPLGITPVKPERIPLTRKAHELRIHAIEAGLDEEMHARLWADALEGGVDIGRIDLLARAAADVGLDHTEARAVLDVDRWSAEVGRLRNAAIASGIQGVPSIKLGSDLMEGVHPVDTIREFVSEFVTAEE